MYKKFLCFLILGPVLSMCSSPKVSYKEYENVANDYSKKKFLSELKAEEDKYSVIFFTEAFFGEKYNVSNNNEVLLDDILETDRVLGLANVIRINNHYDVKVLNVKNGYTFTIPSKKSKVHKYIYISKTLDAEREYEINYSHTLTTFQ